MQSLTKRPVRAVRVAALQAIVDRRENGVIYVRSPQMLGEYPARVTDRLEYWAIHAPWRIFLAQRAPDGRGKQLPSPRPWRVCVASPVGCSLADFPPLAH